VRTIGTQTRFALLLPFEHTRDRDETAACATQIEVK